MGEIKTFFFDTYAFCEILNGNPAYDPYKEDIAIITTKLNLMELHYGLLIERGKLIADRYFDEFSEFCIDIDVDTIKQANGFKAMHKKKGISYIDSLGYIIAKKRNVRFLTGDRQFEHIDNVEFVK